ncbi:IclR family transcriptional regulator [Breoghania sp. L-A4]|uniref:IclR family transcriptional regulator n=1 Tax=Breoghania sp. L-A4 TaxID=2304600 RepID=UPI000E35DDDC|nr:IclR family transcriptional regulator [Breoghania sp. L-A4]AXS41673.1 IclR family transcriptional regulator [Breoghania sp. L-A4]
MATQTSLERVLAVLELFSEDRLEWTPEELMETLGYSRPTLYRYLKTLKEAGLLTSLPNAGFTLGPKVVEMDYLMRKSDALVLNGETSLKALSDRYPCSALLVRWYGDKILCVASTCSTPDPLSSYPRGRPMPLARGAISRAIMAFMPRRQLLPMIERNFEELQDIGLGDTIDAIRARIRQVKKAGYAVAYGEVTPGVVGVAAPVFDAAKIPIAAVCVTIAAETFADLDLKDVGAQVKAAASAISAQLFCERSESPGHSAGADPLGLEAGGPGSRP